jgi:hypothetical protein
MGLLGLLVAIGTGVVSYLQYRSAEKQIQMSHEDAKRQIEISHNDSVDVMKRSNRAYVGIQASAFRDTIPKSKDVGALVHVTAIGSSPALNAVVRRGCVVAEGVGKHDEVSPPPEVWNKLKTHPGHADIFPNTSADYHCFASPGNDEMFQFFVVGDVSYADVFGDAHKTTFCFYGDPDVHDSEFGKMWPCTTGNSMN